MTESQARGSSPLDRRQFLLGAAGVAAGVTLAGCSGGGGGAAAPNKNAVKTPTFVPFTGAKPDLPATADGVPAGHFSYPADPVKFVKEKPAGGPISWLIEGTGMTPSNKNQWLQQVARATGTEFKISLIPSADYLKKFQVAVAGGNLQDVVQINTIADLPQVLDKEFADLSDYLSGDNIKNYPGLASIQTSAWQIPTLNGRIWGIPQPRNAGGSIMSTRGDLLKKYGVGDKSPIINSGEDFLELCKQLSDKKRGKYALGSSPNTFILLALSEMCGVPNQWKIEGGKFVSQYVTDEFKLALEQVTKMWKLGYIHPDSFATPGENITWWSGGVTSLYIQSIAGWGGYSVTYPNFDIGVLASPKWHGGGLADKVLGLPGYSDYAALRKAKPARIKEILRVLDYVASPFGSQEFLDVNYGVKGVDYTIRGTDPIQTPRGGSDYIAGVLYCGSQVNQDLYVPGHRDIVKDEHEYLTKVMPTGVPNPAQGLYSQAAVTVGATALTNLQNGMGDIIQGRRKLSDYDAMVKTWKRRAGDAIANDLEKAYAKVHGNH